MGSGAQKEFIIGSLIGGAIGVAAMLLLAPMSGERLRREVRNRLDKQFHTHTVKHSTVKRKPSPALRIKNIARRKPAKAATRRVKRVS